MHQNHILIVLKKLNSLISTWQKYQALFTFDAGHKLSFVGWVSGGWPSLLRKIVTKYSVDIHFESPSLLHSSFFNVCCTPNNSLVLGQEWGCVLPASVTVQCFAACVLVAGLLIMYNYEMILRQACKTHTILLSYVMSWSLFLNVCIYSKGVNDIRNVEWREKNKLVMSNYLPFFQICHLW